tara:strand:+ start:3462 stop:5099 length:1638 start_codon:yes stop_codon:yes gene_type:complete
MSDSNVFLSKDNCSFLYNVIQNNVKLETNVDINKNPSYYKILTKMLDVVHKNTIPENRTLSNLNNTIINKTIPYFCNIAKKQQPQNNTPQNNTPQNNIQASNNLDSMFSPLDNNVNNLNFEIQSKGSSSFNNNVKSIENFTSMMNQKNAQNEEFLSQKKMSDFKNSNEMFEGNNSIFKNVVSDRLEPFRNKKPKKPKSKQPIEPFFDAGNSYTKLETAKKKKVKIENFQSEEEVVPEQNYSNDELSHTERAIIGQTATKELVVDYLICVDSKDASTNDKPYEFTVLLGQPMGPNPPTAAQASVPSVNLRNVVEVELISCIIPKYPFEEINGNRFVVLQIEELNGTIYGTNTAINRAFALLVPDREYVEHREVDVTQATTEKEFNSNSDVAAGGDEKIDIASHGYSNGDIIRYSARGGIPVGGLIDGHDYYVVNKSTNDFEVSLTSGGSAVDITAATTGETHSFSKYAAASGDTTTSVKKYVLCKNLHPKKVYYRNPLGRLNSLTIKFMNPNGEQKQANNSEAWSTYWDTSAEVSIMLKISCLETK